MGVEDDAFDMVIEQQLLEGATCYYYDSKNVITMDIEPIMTQHVDHKVAMSPSIVPLSCDDKLDDIGLLEVQEEAQDPQEDNPPASLEHHVARTLGTDDVSAITDSEDVPFTSSTRKTKGKRGGTHEKSACSLVLSRPPPKVVTRRRRSSSVVSLSSSQAVEEGRLVQEKTDLDIIFGRGQPFRDHTGNVRMRAIVSQFAREYRQVRKPGKSRILTKIIDMIKRSGARFLIPEDGKGIDGPFRETNEKKEIRAKIGHAFRDAQI